MSDIDFCPRQIPRQSVRFADLLNSPDVAIAIRR